MRINPKGILQFTLGVFIFFICTVLLLQLWNADINIPFGYSGDYLSASAMIKTTIDQGWYIHNPMLGAPFELNMNNYPLGGDNFNFILIKLISLFSNNYAVVTNLFYLVTYLLAYVISFFVMRYLKINFTYSLFGSLLFTFLPYHFFRGNGGHLFLTGYYIIPLVILVSFWIFEGKIKLIPTSKNQFTKKHFLSYMTAILIASTSVYYAFFAGFFWMVSAVYTGINKRDRHAIYNGSLLTIVTVLMLVVNFMPTIIYKMTNPLNTEVAYRSPIDSEIYGLKIVQIFMPILDHRISLFNDIAQRYLKAAPLVNENHTVSLGILGSIGFLILIFSLFYRKKSKFPKLMSIQNMGILNIYAILLSTIGGFSFLIAAFITPSIRGYNRIIPYIGFMSLLCVVIFMQILDEKYQGEKYSFLLKISMVLILVLGILDQTSEKMIPNYIGIKQEFESDKVFYGQIEKELPSNSKIFQLPYIPFPEHPVVNKMGDYDHLRAFLQTESIRWSYGALRGSTEDLIIRNIANQKEAELLHAISFAGYDGIMINRDGYTESSIEHYITQATKGKTIVSNDNKLIFIDIRDYVQSIKNSLNENQWKQEQDTILNPVVLSFGKGIYDKEEDGTSEWRWIEQNSELTIRNLSDRERRIEIEGDFSSNYMEKSELLISSEKYRDILSVSSTSTKYKKVLNLSPREELKLVISTNAQRVNAPNDPRSLYLQIRNFRFRTLE